MVSGAVYTWGGNGFSVQMAFIHIDTDHKKGSGVQDGLPGTNVRFSEDRPGTG